MIWPCAAFPAYVLSPFAGGPPQPALHTLIQYTRLAQTGRKIKCFLAILAAGASGRNNSAYGGRKPFSKPKRDFLPPCPHLSPKAFPWGGRFSFTMHEQPDTLMCKLPCGLSSNGENYCTADGGKGTLPRRTGLPFTHSPIPSKRPRCRGERLFFAVSVLPRLPSQALRASSPKGRAREGMQQSLPLPLGEVPTKEAERAFASVP